MCLCLCVCVWLCVCGCVCKVCVCVLVSVCKSVMFFCGSLLCSVVHSFVCVCVFGLQKAKATMSQAKQTRSRSAQLSSSVHAILEQLAEQENRTANVKDQINSQVSRQNQDHTRHITSRSASVGLELHQPDHLYSITLLLSKNNSDISCI